MLYLFQRACINELKRLEKENESIKDYIMILKNQGSVRILRGLIKIFDWNNRSE